VFAEEFFVCDAESTLWQEARPLLNLALKLEQQDEQQSWHGWQKQQIAAFLQGLPPRCSLLVGVWEAGEELEEQERLALGIICEVVNGEICSLRTFEALTDPKLPAIAALEPGIEHARELMRVTRTQVAPVAWAIFTDRATWQEWLFTESSEDSENSDSAESDPKQAHDKGALLAAFVRQGRCVLMGNRAMQSHHYFHL
jgi:hypothetical protein